MKTQTEMQATTNVNQEQGMRKSIHDLKNCHAENNKTWQIINILSQIKEENLSR